MAIQFLLASAALTLSFGLRATALTKELVVSNVVSAQDGFSKTSTFVNEVYPAPLLTVNKGENFQLNVINNLSDPQFDLVTSVHWHGLFQAHTAWADGAPFVTECPIIPGQSFFYNFSSAEQTGTYWYHSHYAVQYCDGLRGPLVIYDPNDPLKYLYDIDDESTVITLSDWYHIPAHQIQGGAMPDSTLINGLGRWWQNATSELAVVNVQYGKRYRFRLVSMSCDPSFTFSIDGHNLTVIEADGVETEPLVVDSLEIYASQRYSLVLNANQSIDNYWIRAKPSLGRNTTFIGGINSAILRYAGANDTDPTSIQTPSKQPLHEWDLHTLVTTPVPGGRSPGAVDKAVNLTLGFSGGKFTVNGTAWDPPSIPILLQILSGAGNPFDLMPSGSIHAIPGNSSSIEITMNGGVLAGPHPIHLHGHNFHVVRSAGSNVYNYDNPVIRDTVNTGSNTSDVTVIRFLSDNPGPWFLHCHIDFHIDAGLAAVFAEDVSHIASNNPVPPEWEQLCPLWNHFIGDAQSN